MNTTTLIENLFNSNFTPSCSWNVPHHAIFLQLANFFVFLGLFFSTSICSGIFCRLMLLVSNLATLLWAWLVTCSGDLLVWNSIFFLINLCHIIFLLVKLHPFIRLPPEIELAYRNLFLPIEMPRHEFKKLYSYSSGIQIVKPKGVYALENQTIDRLTLVLSGRFSVVKAGTHRDHINCYQFIESQEWFGIADNNSEKYKFSIIALEETQILVWNKDKLKLSISTDRYLQRMLDYVLGRDVVKKLFCLGSLDIESANMSEEAAKLIPSSTFEMEAQTSL